MGLFFNYDRPGKGVSKDAPKKRGVFLFFELLWRNFGKLILTNILYVLVSLPVMAVYFLMAVYLSSMFFGDALGGIFDRLVTSLVILFTIFFGTGPMSCGFTYVLRSFARDEPVWAVSDMFLKAKENFKQGLCILIADIFVITAGGIAIILYMNMARGGNSIFLFLLMVVVMVMLFYTCMHFYLYELAVTFEDKVGKVFKNAVILAMATLPVCILLLAVIVICSSFIFGYLTSIGMAAVSLICWVGFMRFIMDFYAARFIKRKLIKAEESDE